MHQLLNFKTPVHSAAAKVVSAKFYPNWSERRRLNVSFAILQMNEVAPETLLEDLNALPAIQSVKTVGQFADLFDMMLEVSVESTEHCLSSIPNWDPEDALEPLYNLSVSSGGLVHRLNDLGHLQGLCTPFVFQTLPHEAFLKLHNGLVGNSSDLELQLLFLEGVEESLNSCRAYLEEERVTGFSRVESGVKLTMASGNMETVTLTDIKDSVVRLENGITVLKLPTSNLYVK
ncbi:hypothetical protein F7U66_00385 [Vibrio parahaemolyticus]|nr:hypothetical protein [Vibrio parahaemolyticus]